MEYIRPEKDGCSQTSSVEARMKIGDLVVRKLVQDGQTGIERRTAREQRERLGHGLVLSKQMAGLPAHPCVTVFYPKTGKIYDIAESLMEVLSAGPRR